LARQKIGVEGQADNPATVTTAPNLEKKVRKQPSKISWGTPQDIGPGPRGYHGSPPRNEYGRIKDASGRPPPNKFARLRNRKTRGLFNGPAKTSDTSRTGKSKNSPAPVIHTDAIRTMRGIRIASAMTCFTRTFNYRKL
jgi:hypothetical protein